MKTLFKIFILTLFSALFLNSVSFSQSDVNEHSIKFFSDQEATLVGEDGLILKTVDAGANWVAQTSGVTNVLYGNLIIDQNISLAVGEDGLILKTTDGGNSWNIVTSPVIENLHDIALFPGSNIVIACGDNGKIIFSDNYGDSWTEMASGTSNNLKRFCLTDNEHGYVVGENSSLLKTMNSGRSWSIVDMSSFGPLNFNSVAVFDLRITIVGDNGVILLTLDGGITWIKPVYPDVEHANLNAVSFLSPFEGVIVGNAGLILKSSDGGLTWYSAQLNITKSHAGNRDLFAVAFSSPTNGISVGQLGASFFSNDGGKSWSDVPAINPNPISLNPKKGPVKLNQNFPNPFNPSTVISYNLPFDASVSLKVYDMLGKEVNSMVNGYQTAGNYNFRFDGTNLSSGIYFYVLRASGNSGEFSKTMRMILTK